MAGADVAGDVVGAAGVAGDVVGAAGGAGDMGGATLQLSPNEKMEPPKGLLDTLSFEPIFSITSLQNGKPSPVPGL